MNPSQLCSSVFIKSETALPDFPGFSFEEWNGWKQLAGLDSSALELVAIRNGWHFSFISTAVQSSAFDLRHDQAVNRALKKIMRTLEHATFNSFEITRVDAHRILLLHHVELLANPRHLWPDAFLHEPDPHHYRIGPRDFRPVFQKAAANHPMVKGI
jgi:hypothetical protein